MARGMRNAGIRIEIEGERELNAQIKRMQQEFKTLTKEIELVQSEFSGQRNSLKALEKEYAATQKAINKLNEVSGNLKTKSEIIQNAIDKETKKRDELKQRLDKEKAVLDELAKTTDKSTVEYQDQEKAVEKLNLEYIKSSATVEDLTKKYAKNNAEIVDTEIKTGKLRGQEEFLSRAIADANNHLDKNTRLMDEDGKKTEETAKAMEKLRQEMDLQGSMEILSQGVSKLVDYYSDLADKIGECVQAYYDFEKAAISISKTTPGLTDEEAAELIDNLAEYIPLTRAELAQIASQGGQYGISKQNLEEYSRVMSALASSTNIGVGDLASVAQLASLLQVGEEDYEKLASTITDLGNKTRTTEKQTVDMAQTIASTGKIIGLTESEIVGMAAALASTGGQARGTGTAMNRFMADMHEAVLSGGDDLEAFAKIAGMSSSQFKQAFQTDTINTIYKVLEGLNDVYQSGGDIYTTMASIGVDSIQEKQNIKNLMMNWSELATTIETANTAWEENTALSEEFGKAVDTNSSQVVLFENKMEGLKKTLGEEWSKEYVEEGRISVGSLVKGITEQLEDVDNWGASTKRMGFKELLEYLTTPHPSTWYLPNQKEFKAGAESVVSQFAEALKTASGDVSPVSQMLESWMDEVGRTTPRLMQGAESPVSQMLDNYLENFDWASQELVKQTERIRKAYESTFDPMEKFSEKGQLTAKEFTKNLQNNTKKMTDYTDNLVKVLNDPRVSDALKEYLKGLDPSEAYNIVEDFANDKDGKLIGSANEAMEKFNGAISDNAVNAGIATGEVTDEVIGALTDADLGGEGYRIGVDLDDGLIKGMASRIRPIQVMSETVVNSIHPVMRRALMINSPSKVTEKIGEYVGEGLVVGMQNTEDDVMAEAARLALLSANVYNGAIVGLQNGFNASINVKTRDYTGVLNQISRNTGRNNTVIVEKPSGKTSQSAVNDLERALVRGMLY